MPGAEQRFATSLGKEAVFEGDGLRSFFEYRDLGIGEATGGRFHAQVIRAKEACGKGTGPHRHELDFQMVYVLKGWATFDYDGQGSVTLRPGDSVLQPPEIRHELTACSEDMELLEITSPADFTTLPA